MKKLTLTTAIFVILGASAAAAAPMCDGPDFNERNGRGALIYNQQREAQTAELKLHGMGINANNTRFWNGCIQTFVTDESGHSQMKFYDPNTLAEIPAN